MPRWIGSPKTTVTGLITATVVSENPPQLVLSGRGEGWETADLGTASQIILSPLFSQTPPVGYTFYFDFGPDYVPDGTGIQISISLNSARIAAIVQRNLPLEIVNSVPSGQNVTMNLAFSLLNLRSQEIISFDDPTIVFDPPQI
jgi:hypothetical protein